MAESRDLPGMAGYDFDQEVEMPIVRTDYDLFGMTEGPDMLDLDRASEQAHRTGGAALFPEREYIINMGRTDIFTGPEDLDAARRGGYDA